MMTIKSIGKGCQDDGFTFYDNNVKNLISTGEIGVASIAIKLYH